MRLALVCIVVLTGGVLGGADVAAAGSVRSTTSTRLNRSVMVMVVLALAQVRRGARESFANTISQTDLIVGARGGTLQLLLYTVFRLGTATNNISYASYEHFRNHPAVAWATPYSLGNSHRGYRVGTTEDFYRHYRYRRDRQIELAEGRIPSGIFDVVLGADVAADLRYRLSDPIVITHGITHGMGLLQHEDKPFIVVGLLKKTATPVDRSLYITLAGAVAYHRVCRGGAPHREHLRHHRRPAGHAGVALHLAQ